MSIEQDSFIESTAVKTKKVFVQVTMIKQDFLHWAATITMGIKWRGRIEYVNVKKKQPNENEHS